MKGSQSGCSEFCRLCTQRLRTGLICGAPSGAEEKQEWVRIPQGLPPEGGGRGRRESPFGLKALMSELKLRPPKKKRTNLKVGQYSGEENAGRGADRLPPAAGGQKDGTYNGWRKAGCSLRSG